MISIIVPIYNVEKYLPKCVESLMRQTLKDIEIILVDDGSPDKSPELCDLYASQDDRIKVIHQKNGGESSARNAGVKAASGEYIGFVDPDDWVSPEMYERMLEVIEKHRADLVICGYHYCHEDGRIDETRKYKIRNVEILSQKEMMRRCSDIPPTIRHVVWNKLFIRDKLKLLIFDESLHASMDVKLLTEYLLKTDKSVFLHEPYYYNRVRVGSATHGGLSINDLAETFSAHQFMYQAIIELYPELKDYSQAFLLDVYLLKFHEAKRIAKRNLSLSEKDVRDLRRMRKALHDEGLRGIFNQSIYWKTRLAYLIS